MHELKWARFWVNNESESVDIERFWLTTHHVFIPYLPKFWTNNDSKSADSDSLLNQNLVHLSSCIFFRQFFHYISVMNYSRFLDCQDVLLTWSERYLADSVSIKSWHFQELLNLVAQRKRLICGLLCLACFFSPKNTKINMLYFFSDTHHFLRNSQGECWI